MSQKVITIMNRDTATLPGQCFLRLMPSVDCNENGFALLLALAALTLVFYMVGWPLLCFHALWVRDHGRLAHAGQCRPQPPTAAATHC